MPMTSLGYLSVVLPLSLMGAALLRGTRLLKPFIVLTGVVYLLLAGQAAVIAAAVFIAINGMIYLLPSYARKKIGLAGNITLVVALRVTQSAPGILAPLLPPLAALGLSWRALESIALHMGDNRPGLNAYVFSTLFFPKLPAGPVADAAALASQRPERSDRWDGLAAGLARIILGLGKKLLIADTLARLSTAAFTTDTALLGAPLALLGAAGYTIQLYFDISGYADMALGTAQALGYRLPENFRTPLRADSMTDFRRRWHISQTEWFRQHVFVPLSGSRKSRWQVVGAITLSFALMGMWHGWKAGFLLWGVWHAVFVAAEYAGLISPERWPAALRKTYVWLCVVVGFVLMRLGNLPAMARYLAALNRHGSVQVLLLPLSPPVLLAFATAVVVIIFEQRGLPGRVPRVLRYLALALLAVVCLGNAAAGMGVPFFYQR